jgi:hypothetical protein
VLVRGVDAIAPSVGFVLELVLAVAPLDRHHRLLIKLNKRRAGKARLHPLGTR